MPTERRLAAIMFTDIVGYTALMAESEEQGLRARARHRELVRPLVEKYHGEAIEARGDESLSVFPTALDAVNCALAIEERVADDPDVPRLHLGIHLGDLVIQNDEVSGDGVNIAARICALSEDGGLRVSGEVRNSIGSQSNLEARPLGDHTLKNVPRPVAVFLMSGKPGPPTSRATGVLAQPELRSIAVLPLENLGDAEHERVADGVTDALIESLACVGPELRVISRTSVMQYKGMRKPAREIARELGVELLVEGTALREDDQVLVRLQLIDAERDAHLWAQSYEREFGGVLRLGREIAGRVADEIEIALEPEAVPRPAGTHTVDPEALDLYLRARALIGPASTATSWGPPTIELLERSVAIDPGFAEGWVWLAKAHTAESVLGGVASSRDGLIGTRDAARRALELDEHLGGAHAQLGLARFYYEWDLPGARRDFERAVKLSPNDPVTFNGLAAYHALVTGKRREVELLYERVLGVAPLDVPARAAFLLHFFMLREYERGLAEAERIRLLDPQFVDVAIPWCYWALGRTEDACREYLAWNARLGPEMQGGVDAFRRGSEERGFEGGLGAQIPLLVQGVELGATVFMVPIACYSALTGETEQAIHWLERAYEARHPQLLAAKNDPRLDPLRSDPRFQDLLRRIGFPEN